jgi:hypothetical protein
MSMPSPLIALVAIAPIVAEPEPATPLDQQLARDVLQGIMHW